MSLLTQPGVKLVIILCMAIIGALVGLVVGTSEASPAPAPAARNVFPLPHHIAKYPGGVSLRFAMAHDVIHERFPKHGKAYYEERNRRVSEALKAGEARHADSQPFPEYWALLDDLAVGLDLLGKHEEAVALMQRKLKEQQELGLSGADLYSTYANWGTFLILWQIQEGFADKDKAKERIGESIRLIHEAIKVKPDSHFGREIWQAVLEEFLLASLDNPDLLLKYDMIGNRLDSDINPQGRRALDSMRWGGSEAHYLARQILQDADKERSPQEEKSLQAERKGLRESITKVGAEEGWKEAAKTSHNEPVPFDEPTLGIIGMWRYGGGANPHFALALGEIMLRVGQRYVAWTAYERAAQLADAFGPGPIKDKFVEHCRKRQKVIESTLSPVDVADRRPIFIEQLKYGKDYQKDYQEYEEKRIKAGDSIDDAHFYDAFHAAHKPIASPIGSQDQYVIEGGHFEQMVAKISIPAILLCAGSFAFLTALGLHFLRPSR
jgi:hypothetical protein